MLLGTSFSAAARLANVTRLAPATTTIRCISYDKLSNRRITRIESSIELEDAEHKPRLVNRNPRNLEQMSLEPKPKGYWLDKSPSFGWNHIEMEQDGRHLVARVRHWSGNTLVEASTREAALSKYFVSPSTTQSAITLAKILSRRCLQSGILNATVKQDLSPKVRIFLDTMTEHGVALEELPEIQPRRVGDL